MFHRLFFIGMLLGGNAAASPESSENGRVFNEGPGLDFKLTSGTAEKKYIVETVSGGVCLFDFDGDGLTDIYLVNGGLLESFRSGKASPLKNALFRNLGKRRFEDVTQRAGVPGNGGWGMGCSVTDADNDGRLDLYVTTYGSNILYHNRGDGTFEDITQRAGVDDPRWSTGAAWADFDRDGDLDLFVANYIELDPNDLPEPGSPRYGSMGGGLGCRYFDLAVMCGPRGLKGAGDSFFVNQGDGTFLERSAQLGMHDPGGYYGMGALWSDFDDNGFPDLYVANDSTPNYLYLNRGDGTFEESGLLSGAAFGGQGQEQAGMGVAAGDYRNSGRFSLYVTHFSEEYNTLYRNEGEGNFTDVTTGSGLLAPSLPFVGWGVFFFDYDNDGWQDLFVANGHVFPQIDRLQTAASAPYKQRPLLFRNLHHGRFEEIGKSVLPDSARSSRGAAFADLDNDGALDIVINNLDGSPTLLWNAKSRDHRFLQLELKGISSNRPAVGARVRLKTEAGWQMQEVRSGDSYLSQNDLRLHFGLGKAGAVERIEVRWPDGKLTVLNNVPADQSITIREQ